MTFPVKWPKAAYQNDWELCENKPLTCALFKILTLSVERRIIDDQVTDLCVSMKIYSYDTDDLGLDSDVDYTQI